VDLEELDRLANHAAVDAEFFSDLGLLGKQGPHVDLARDDAPEKGAGDAICFA
jgi:hypothetical protein